MKTRSQISPEMLTNAVLQTVAGAIPFAGGLLSAAVSLHSEIKQNETNLLLQSLVSSLEDDFQTLALTMSEINQRIDLCEEKVCRKVSGKAYQNLFKKVVRNWSEVDSEQKRIQVRNLLVNFSLCKSDDEDKIKQYIEWVIKLSPLEIKILSIIRASGEVGMSREVIWKTLGNEEKPREVSRQADFFRFAMHNLQNLQMIRVKRKLEVDGRLTPKEYEMGVDIQENRTFDPTVPFRLTRMGEEFAAYSSEDISVIG